MQIDSESPSASALLWTKRGWLFFFAACLVVAALSRPFNWIWLASAVACLVIALDTHERLSAVRGKPCRWRDVFDWEDPLTAWLNKQASNNREGK
ncbi:Uncharacterised protein [Burkholderia pseudomallei]|uniref:hypothetical protein n=1 Tax=Burkholderia pseudomallei TaxID=28450 RepID=UPI00155DC2D7|nr:hypothetical protein [Burkholderia pseudomallei]CAJ6512245.1 Uncharacterised protein [Burkholderia pseudomallei]